MSLIEKNAESGPRQNSTTVPDIGLWGQHHRGRDSSVIEIANQAYVVFSGPKMLAAFPVRPVGHIQRVERAGRDQQVEECWRVFRSAPGEQRRIIGAF